MSLVIMFNFKVINNPKVKILFYLTKYLLIYFVNYLFYLYLCCCFNEAQRGPHCNEQQYISSAESGEEVECDCGKKYVFE